MFGKIEFVKQNCFKIIKTFVKIFKIIFFKQNNFKKRLLYDRGVSSIHYRYISVNSFMYNFRNSFNSFFVFSKIVTISVPNTFWFQNDL